MARKRNSNNAKNGKQKNWRRPDSDEQQWAKDDKFKTDRNAKNDPNWYNRNLALTSSVVNLPFSYQTGLPLPLGMTVSNTYPKPADLDYPGADRVPGIMRLTVAPSIGNSLDNTSPINVAATALYSFVRHANSGTAYGDPADTMIFMLAMSQVYSAIVWLQRIYGEVMLYSQQNRYIPQGLVIAEGVDFNSIVTNAADFRYGINLAIAKAAAFAVPNVFTYFQRQAFLYSSVYTEGESIRDQLYMYVPGGFWFYTEGTEQDAASRLTYKKISSFGTGDPLTYTQLLSIVNEMMQPLLGSEDIGILSGNILKAFGESNVVKLQPLPENYFITPVYDVGVLEQMKNATVWEVCGSAGVYASGAVPMSQFVRNDVYQDKTLNKGGVVSTPHLLISSSELSDEPSWKNGTIANTLELVFCSNRIMTTQQANPTNDTILENTRLMSIAPRPSTSEAEDQWVFPTNAGAPANQIQVPIRAASEIVVDCTIFTLNPLSPVNFEPTIVPAALVVPDVIGTMTNTQVQNFLMVSSNWALHVLQKRTKFKFAPRVLFLSADPAAESPTPDNTTCTANYNGDFFEYSNYTVIDYNEITKLNESVLMNMFYVPSVGSL